jgi:micrococcal nuclease
LGGIILKLKELKSEATKLGITTDQVRAYGSLRRKATWEDAIKAISPSTFVQLQKTKERFEYQFKVKKLIRVVDGDTIDVVIDLGFDSRTKQRVRLYGIDTPESRTKNKEEKALGLASKARLKDLVENASSVWIKTYREKGKGKFGRCLGIVFADDVNVNDQLVLEGHARKYFGGTKVPWV